MTFSKYYILTSYFSLKLSKSILLTWLILISIITILDISDLYNKTRLKNNITFDHIFLLTLESIPLRADTVLLYAVLFGTVLCFLELRKTQEFIILRINGLSIWKSFLMIAVVPLIFGILSILILNPLVAITQNIYLIHHDSLFDTGINTLTISNDGLWIRDKSNFGGVLIRGDHLEPNLGKITNPIFFLQKTKDQLSIRINADWAILKNKIWRLENAKIDGENFNSSKKIFIQSILTKKDLNRTASEPESLSVFQLPRFIKILESTGISSSRYKIYFHKVISQPIAFIGITALVAASIFGWFSRTPPTRMTVFALCGGFFYFFIQRLSSALGSSEQIPILIASWLPSVMLLVIGIFLLALIEEI